ncbi:hypothetical protein [Alicyclobacillus acidoterrestris]|uniref:hypothetical protein n=1 Tax=Alicyclobacillus acidoterrestris TaxID=1450 RepID=UPI0003858848|nr:hypothetical protein N007_19040 [Alicyclobacillus acidoterrestris ATCC 49025]
MDQLAPHETLELHELLASNSIGLAKHKSTLRKIQDPELRQLYFMCIQQGEKRIQELAAFLKMEVGC